MNDFFGNLEHELRVAAERPRRRAPAARGMALAFAVGAIALAALVSSLVLGGGDGRETADRPQDGLPAIGTVIEKGEGNPPRPSRATVVATGRTPVAGRWQLEVYRGSGVKDPKTGEVYEPAGLRCLMIVPVDDVSGGGAGGFCAEGNLGFRGTPGFSRAQMSSPTEGRVEGRRIRAKEVLVFGRVPERAASVVVTGGRGVRTETRTHEGPRSLSGDFFVIPVRPGLGRARVNWLRRDGRPGSRGIGLMPPITKR